jgi:O-antigen/teichoic acid export membrane protein
MQGAAGTFIAQLTAIVAGIASQLLLARLLPPDALGSFFLTQSLVLTCACVGEFGLNRPVARMIAADVGAHRVGAARRVLQSAILIASISGAIVVLALEGGFGRWLAIEVFDSTFIASTIVLVGFWLAARMILSIGAAVLQGLYRVGLSALFSGTLSGVILACASGILLLTGTDVEYRTIIVIAAAATVSSSAICAWIVLRTFAGVEPEGPSRTRELFGSTLPVYAAGLLQITAIQGDMWIVGAQLDPSDVALYGAAKRLTVLVGFPVVALSVVVPPMISDLYARGETLRLQRLLRGATTGACLPAIVVFALFMIFGREILTIAYGDVYGDAAIILQILCAQKVVFILLGTGSLLLLMTGNERVIFRTTIISAPASLLAIYLGGRLGGLSGVAAGFALSSSATAVWYFVAAHRYTKIWVHVSPFALRPIVEVVQRMIQSTR